MKVARYALDARSNSPNSPHTPSIPKSKTDLSEYYNFEEATGHKTGFARSQPQGSSKLPGNIQRQGKLISKSEQESNRVASHTAQIFNPLRGGGGGDSLKSVMLCVVEEAKFRDGKELPFRKLISYHKGGVTKQLKTLSTNNNARTDKKTGSPISLLYFLLITAFGPTEEPTAPKALKGGRSGPRERHIKHVSREIIRACLKGRWWKLCTISYRSHCMCVLQGITHQH